MKLKNVLLIAMIFFLTAGLAPVFAETEAVEVKAAEPTLEIVEIKLCTTVEDRVAVDAATEFPNTTAKVYCWVKVTGASADDPQKIYQEWYYKGEEKASVELNIAGSPWRTWASKALWHTWVGEWTVKIVDADGNVLKEVTFTVTSAEVEIKPVAPIEEKTQIIK